MTNDTELRVIKLGITNRVLINRHWIFFETMGNKKIRVHQCPHSPAALQKYFNLKELPLQIVVKGDNDELIDIQEMEAGYVNSNTSSAGSLEKKCPYLNDMFDHAARYKTPFDRELKLSNSTPEMLVGNSFIVQLSSNRRADLLVKNPFLMNLFNQTYQGDRSEDAEIPPLEINVLEHIERNVYLVEANSTYNPDKYYRERFFATIGTPSETSNTKMKSSGDAEALDHDQYENYEILDIEPMCHNYFELILEAWCSVRNKRDFGAVLPLKGGIYILNIPFEQIQSPFFSHWRLSNARPIFFSNRTHYLECICKNIAEMLSWKQKEQLWKKMEELAWSEKYSFTVDRKEMTPPGYLPSEPYAFTSTQNSFADESLRDYLGFDGPFSDSELGD